jgi:hypothetical protein
MGEFSVMQILQHRKDLYNDAENPLYDAGHTPILGASGMLQDHADRVSNLETIHGKLGWHGIQVKEASYFRPDDMMVYYGWINSFNSGTNGWNNETVAQDLAKYEVLVFGSGIAAPAHGDYANTSVIVARIKALRPEGKIFGYVATTLSLSNFEDQVDDWDNLNVQGIMMDEAGYDYGTNRADFNARVDYVHAKGMIVMANAWNEDHVIGTVDDVSYPNSTYNSGAVASSLGANDWYMLESAPINTTAFSGADGYQPASDWAARGVKAISRRATYGINTCAVGIINDDNADGQDLFDFGFIAALMFSLDAFSISDTSYGSGSAKGKWWTRPDVSGMGMIHWLNPSVQVDVGDSDVYIRYVQFGKLKIDFSTSAQDSEIVKH